MSDSIVVAVLGLIGTLSGSFLGILASSKLTQYRLNKLEEKVNLHNSYVERTFVLEGEMKECLHDIEELKEYHRPNHVEHYD